jgi:hypothetical protein
VTGLPTAAHTSRRRGEAWLAKWQARARRGGYARRWLISAGGVTELARTVDDAVEPGARALEAGTCPQRRHVQVRRAAPGHWSPGHSSPGHWRGGALGGIRTPNLLIRSQMLYPLSYERLWVERPGEFSVRPRRPRNRPPPDAARRGARYARCLTSDPPATGCPFGRTVSPSGRNVAANSTHHHRRSRWAASYPRRPRCARGTGRP